MEPNFKLKISADADLDLAALYEHGLMQWGEEQADCYFDALLTHFEQLCKNPLLYAAVDYIRPAIAVACAASTASITAWLLTTWK